MKDQVQPTGASKSEIERFGSEVAHAFAYEIGGDLVSFVERLGGRVEISSLDGSEDAGALVSNGDGSFVIHLSPYTNALRDRFTIAHELGHFFLHADLGRKRLKVARSGSDRAEWEANWFAAGFLMPEQAFKLAAKRLPSLGALAAHFGVSPHSILIRKQALGIRDTT